MSTFSVWTDALCASHPLHRCIRCAAFDSKSIWVVVHRTSSCVLDRLDMLSTLDGRVGLDPTIGTLPLPRLPRLGLPAWIFHVACDYCCCYCYCVSGSPLDHDSELLPNSDAANVGMLRQLACECRSHRRRRDPTWASSCALLGSWRVSSDRASRGHADRRRIPSRVIA